MMLARRSAKHSTNMFSPRNSSSSNRKQLEPHRHPNPVHVGWSATAATESDEDDNESRITGGGGGGGGGCSSSRTDVKNNNWEVMLMAFGGTKKRRDSSSYGSCGDWSMGSLMERCPATPSPICSPVSSFSCSPPSELYFSQLSTDLSGGSTTGNQDMQSSCIIDGKKSASAEEVGEQRREDTNRGEWEDQDDSRQLKLQGPLKPDARHKKPKTTAVGPSVPPHISCNPTELFYGSDRDGGDCDRKLPIVREEQEERVCKNGRHLGLPHVHHGTHLCYDDGYAVDSDDDDDGSRYENSDLESAIEEHLGLSHAYEAKRNDVEARLTKWKEARTLKLMNRLRKKEAEIVEWMVKQTTKAKMDMREFEMKLEKKRGKALDKMQGRILTAQKKAEKKKLKERACALKKMAEVAEAFEKIGSTGKLPWKLICS